jgi:uncharacterized protein (TIGR02217 family)
MSNIIHYAFLPRNIAINAVGGPSLLTDVAETDVDEQRNRRRETAPGLWSINYKYLTHEQIRDLEAFLLCRYGQWAGFFFWDHLDHEFDYVTVTGSYDGATESFNLIKPYKDGYGFSFNRRICFPDNVMKLYVDNAKWPDDRWSWNESTKQIDLGTPKPGTGTLIRAKGEYHNAVRFGVDRIPRTLHSRRIASMNTIPIRELYLNEQVAATVQRG